MQPSRGEVIQIMRINVYNEEITNDAVFVSTHVEETGKTYYGFRFFLKSAPELHSSNEDDDRSAITIWFGTKALAYHWLTAMQQKAAVEYGDTPLGRKE